MADGSNSVLVAVRCRPPNSKERAHGAADSPLEVMRDRVVLKASDFSDKDIENPIWEEKEFGYDHVFDDSFTQERVYDAIGEPLLKNAMNAYNGCVFAYGQTGSGKTHSMVGDAKSEAGRGVQPRACMRLFELLAEKQKENTSFQATVLATYMEIYNEKIFDLLCGAESSKDELNVRLHPTLGPIVANLKECPIQNYSDAAELFDFGAKRRAVGATQMNETSSRSHAIFTVQIRTSVKVSGGTTESQAKVHFVDLAGSERQKKTQASGTRLKEGIGINQSLSTLSRVISDLSNGKGLPPFRESKLTLLLKDALMGNSRTALLACISTARYNLAETISTLEFAARCKLVKTQARKNEESRADVIQKLTAEKEALESQLQSEMSRSDELCAQLQLELEKAEQAEKGAQEAISAKREIEGKLHAVELEHASLAKALEEKSAQGQSAQHDGEVLRRRRNSEQERDRLAEQLAELEQRTQHEISELEERERTSQELRNKLEEELQARKEREQTFQQQIEDLKAHQESWAVDPQSIQVRREEQQRHREAELQRLGMHAAGIDPKDVACAPRLMNLHPDPALKGCLVYYLPTGESVIGSDEERCRVRLAGAGISAEVCVISNVDNMKLSVKRISEQCLVRINGVLVEMAGRVLADGDRLAVGRAAIFKVHIPNSPQDGGTGHGALEFEAAMEEIEACVQVDPLWENGLRKAMQLVRSDYGDEDAKTLLALAKRASEIIGTANDYLEQTAPSRRGDVEIFEMSIMFDAWGLPAVCVVARARSPESAEDVSLWSLDKFCEESDKPSSRGTKGPTEIVGIWELQRFEEEYLPLLQERMAEAYHKPWAQIESEDEVDKVTIYTIRVTRDSSDSVRKKKYNDFLEFDKLLRSKPDLREVLSAMPPLPKTGVLGVRHALGFKNYSKDRREGLQTYIDFLMDNLNIRQLEGFL